MELDVSDFDEVVFVLMRVVVGSLVDRGVVLANRVVVYRDVVYWVVAYWVVVYRVVVYWVVVYGVVATEDVVYLLMTIFTEVRLSMA